MKVQMLKTQLGSLNGRVVHEFIEGCEYDIPEDLYKAFKELNAIIDIGIEKKSPVVENKVAKPVVETKVKKKALKKKKDS